MLCITFDNFGCGSGKLPPCPFPDLVPEVEWDHYNEIGLTLGHPRILQLLRQLAIPTTFFAEGYSAVLHPDEVKRWRNEGHEIALHGWKHETWSTISSAAAEDELVGLAVSAMGELLGQQPLGFRPPGLQINAWTDEVMERHGIRYIAQATGPTADPRFAALGIRAQEERPHHLTRLPLLPCSARLIDGDLLAPAHGGLFGQLDAQAAYEAFFDMALQHESATTQEPWVFIVHPFISGNRAWPGLEKFLRRLHAEFGSGAFRTGRQIALDGHADERGTQS